MYSAVEVYLEAVTGGVHVRVQTCSARNRVLSYENCFTADTVVRGDIKFIYKLLTSENSEA